MNDPLDDIIDSAMQTARGGAATRDPLDDIIDSAMAQARPSPAPAPFWSGANRSAVPGASYNQPVMGPPAPAQAPLTPGNFDQYPGYQPMPLPPDARPPSSGDILGGDIDRASGMGLRIAGGLAQYLPNFVQNPAMPGVTPDMIGRGLASFGGQMQRDSQPQPSMPTNFQRALGGGPSLGMSVAPVVAAGALGGPLAGAAVGGLMQAGGTTADVRETLEAKGDPNARIKAIGAGAASGLGGAAINYLPIARALGPAAGAIMPGIQARIANIAARYGPAAAENALSGLGESVVDQMARIAAGTQDQFDDGVAFDSAMIEGVIGVGLRGVADLGSKLSPQGVPNGQVPQADPNRVPLGPPRLAAGEGERTGVNPQLVEEAVAGSVESAQRPADSEGAAPVMDSGDVRGGDPQPDPAPGAAEGLIPDVRAEYEAYLAARAAAAEGVAKPPLTRLGLGKSTEGARAKGGISSLVKKKGLDPAFRDGETGKIYPSMYPAGHANEGDPARPASVHIMDGLPDELVVKRDDAKDLKPWERQMVLEVKGSVEPGFVDADGKFYTRQEAADLNTPSPDLIASLIEKGRSDAAAGDLPDYGGLSREQRQAYREGYRAGKSTTAPVAPADPVPLDTPVAGQSAESPRGVVEQSPPPAASRPTPDPLPRESVEEVPSPKSTTPAAKQPWEMTRGEAAKSVSPYIKAKKGPDGRYSAGYVGTTNRSEYLGDRTFSTAAEARLQHNLAEHAAKVKDALRAGNPVPSEVLAEYPDLKPSAPPPAPAARAKPLKMDGTVRPDKAAPAPRPPLPQRSIDVFNKAMTDLDGQALSEMVDPANKGWRAMFEERTGLTLPKTVGGSSTMARQWVMDQSPAAKPKEPAAKQPHEMALAEYQADVQNRASKAYNHARKLSEKAEGFVRWVGDRHLEPVSREAMNRPAVRAAMDALQVSQDIKDEFSTYKHKEFVDRAIAEGKIKSHPDYPDLKPKEPPRAEPEPAKEPESVTETRVQPDAARPDAQGAAEPTVKELTDELVTETGENVNELDPTNEADAARIMASLDAEWGNKAPPNLSPQTLATVATAIKTNDAARRAKMVPVEIKKDSPSPGVTVLKGKASSRGIVRAWAEPGKEAEMVAALQKASDSGNKKTPGIGAVKGLSTARGPQAGGKLPATAAKTTQEKIKSITEFASKENSRYAISGYLVAKGGSRLVATDGRRLAMLDGTPGEFGKDGVYHANSDGKAMDGNFPPYEDVIPKTTREVFVGAVDTLDHLRQASVFDPGDSQISAVVMVLNKDGTLGFASQSDAGQVEANVRPGFEVIGAYNAGFLGDAIRFLARNDASMSRSSDSGAKPVQIQWTSSTKPIIVSGGNGNVAKVVTMPINLEKGNTLIANLQAEYADASVAPPAIGSKLLAAADKAEKAARARIAKRPGIPRGRGTGASIIGPELADRAMIVAAKVIKAGVRTAQAIEKAFLEMQAELGTKFDNNSARKIKYEAQKILARAHAGPKRETTAQMVERLTGKAKKPEAPKEAKNSWDMRGADLGNVFHGGKTIVGEIDPSKLNKRDPGFYGKGFYATKNSKFAGSYGPKISEFSVNPDARVLMASTMPADAPAGLVDAVKAWTFEAGREAAEKRGKLEGLRQEVDLIDRSAPAAWSRAVDKYAEAHGYDIVIHNDGEVVIKNPKVLKSVKSVPVPAPKPAAKEPERTNTVEHDPDQTSARMGWINADRRDILGLPETDNPGVRTHAMVLDRAKEMIKAEPDMAMRLVRELEAKPDLISDVETAVMAIKWEELGQEHAKLMKSGEGITDPDAIAELASKIEHVQGQMIPLSEQMRKSGSEIARALKARQLTIDNDLSLATVRVRATIAKGSKLTAEETAHFDKLSKDLADVEQEIEANKERYVNATLDAMIEDLKRQVAAPPPAPATPAGKPKIVDKFVLSLNEAAEAARARIKARTSKLYSGIAPDPAALADEIIIGASHIANGIVKGSAWAGKMVSEFGAGIKPYLRTIYGEAYKKATGQAAAADAIPGAKTTKEKMTARVEDGADVGELGAYLNEMALELVRSGVTKRDALLDALHKEVKEAFPNITKKQVRDILSGYGKFVPLDKEAAKVRLREIKSESQKLAQLEALVAKKAPLATGFERQAPSAEARALTKQVNEAKKKAGILPGGAGRLKTLLETTKNRLRNQISDMQAEIDTGKRIVRGKSVPLSDPELATLKKTVADLRKLHDAAFKAPKLTDEQKRANAALGTAKRAVEDAEQRLKDAKAGNFGTDPAKPTVSTPEIDALKAKAAEARAELKKVEDAALGGPVKIADDEKRLNAAVAAAKRSVEELEKRLSDAKQGNFGRDPSNPGVTSPELAALKAKADEARAKLKEVEDEALGGRVKRTEDEKRLTAAKAAAKRSAEEWERRLQEAKNGRFENNPKNPPVSTAEITALKARAEAARSRVAELKDADPTQQAEKEADWIHGYRTRLAEQTADLHQQLAANEFKPPAARRGMPKTAEIERLAYLRDRARSKVRRAIANKKPKGPLQKGMQATKEVVGFSRQVLTSLFDVSAIGRQGIVAVAGHPRIAGKAIATMTREMLSRVKAHANYEKAMNSENAPLYKRAKLYLASMDHSTLTSKEEGYQTNITESISELGKERGGWVSKIAAPVRAVGHVMTASERAYNGFLNSLRVQMFDQLVHVNGKSQESIEAAANYINLATGRGKLYGFERSGDTLAKVLFSPRLMMSRLELLAGEPIAFAKGKDAKFMVMREYARTMIGFSVMAGLATLAGGEFVEDPRKTDFGMMKFGDMRVDFFGGLPKYIRGMARLITRVKINADGKEKDLTGYDTAHEFYGMFRSKASPIAGSLLDLLYTGEDYADFGDKKERVATVKEELQQLFTPMTFSDAKNLFDKEGLDTATAGTIFNLLGFSSKSYAD